MSLETTVETLRLVNVALATIALTAYLLRINRVWELRSRGQRTVRVGIILLLFATAYASAEAFVQQATIGFRSVFVTAACLVVLLGLWRVRNEPEPRNHWS